ncbi:MAG: AtpZ/AtpI family protein [Pseudomonadota bacterium]
MTSRPPDDPLDELGAKIDALRDGRKPKPATKGGKYAAAGFGWRMTVDLVTGIFVGAAMGWGLDSLFGTLPIFLIIFIMLGFAAGVRVMLKSAEEYQKDQARPDKDDTEG